MNSPTTEQGLAPRWHTYALIALMLAVAITGTLSPHSPVPPAAHALPRIPSRDDRIVAQYLPLLLVNWGLTLYVARLFRPHNALPALLGRRTGGLRGGLVDFVCAAGVGLAIELIELAWSRGFAVGPNAAIVTLLPSTVAERLTWVLVAVSVGFCEEVVYRGYLQTQLTAFSGRASVGVALQALLFGIAHGEQGLAAALRMAIYGLLLGALARYRKSLLPGIACHIGIDLASGLLR